MKKSWLVDGQYPFFEFLHYFNISEEEVRGYYNTIRGLLLHKVNHIPQGGEKVNWQKFEFEIMDMDEQRIDVVLVSLNWPLRIK